MAVSFSNRSLLTPPLPRLSISAKPSKTLDCNSSLSFQSLHHVPRISSSTLRFAHPTYSSSGRRRRSFKAYFSAEETDSSVRTNSLLILTFRVYSIFFPQLNFEFNETEVEIVI